MCASNEKWDMVTLRCVPDSSKSSAGTSSAGYDGSSTIWGNIGGWLTGGASVIAALKGNPATVVNSYGNPSQNNGSGNTTIYIGGAILLLVVLFMVFKK